MRTRSKKQKDLKPEEIVWEDRLCQLPDEILVHILSYLPTLDAVRTVALRRFGDLWTLVPTLVFDDKQFYQIVFKKNGYPSRREKYRRFDLFVRNVMTHHKREALDKFQLDIVQGRKEMVAGGVKAWWRSVLGREIKALDICYLSNRVMYPLPPRLFTSQSLVRLKLSGVSINLPHQVSMPSLKELSISEGLVSVDTFQALISGCSSLQELDIVCPDVVDELCFTNPSLQKLTLYKKEYPCVVDCPNLKILDLQTFGSLPDLIDVSGLSEVNIREIDCDPDSGTPGEFKSFLTELQSVDVFELKMLAFDTILMVMEELDFPENRWKRLILHFREHENTILAVCKWLRRTVHLEELIIYAYPSCYNMYHPYSRKLIPGAVYDCSMLSLELCSPCIMPQLKTITIHGYDKSFKAQLLLIEFLLKNAVVLEKLVIITQKNVLTASEELDFLKHLSSFQRASTTARVIFELQV